MFGKIKNYFIQSYEETKKIIWPSRKEVTSHSTIVVISMVVAMGITAAIDWALFRVIELLIYR